MSPDKGNVSLILWLCIKQKEKDTTPTITQVGEQRILTWDHFHIFTLQH